LTELPFRFLPSPPGSGDYTALDKPAGRIVHGPGGLLGEIRGALGPDLHLVHRLDRATSGILLLARGGEALAAAHAVWARDVEKVYLTVTRGIPEQAEGAVDFPLLEHRTAKPELMERALKAAYGAARAGNLMAGKRVKAIPELPPPGRTAAHPAGRPASTTYRVLDTRDGCALVELRPSGGRMHQLRVHMLAIGTPIANDPFYDEMRDGSAPFLHALRLTWRNPPCEEEKIWTWDSRPLLPAPFGSP
jgi:23S rRNA-/tRNA-specific pseudouridylate synthase